MQQDLFDGVAAPVVRSRRPPVVKPPASIEPKAQYHGFLGDLVTLADAWADLHVWVLVRNLRLLASVHTEPAERDDILSWLEAPAAETPAAFSAQACLTLYDPRIDLPDFQQSVRAINRRVVMGRSPARTPRSIR